MSDGKITWYPGVTVAKDPNETLDWLLDFAAATNGTAASDWLPSGDSIASATCLVTGGGISEVTGSRLTGTGTVQVWISGGTAGQTGSFTVRATTNQGRIVDRSVNVEVADR